MYFRAEASWKLFKLNGLDGITVLQATNRGFFRPQGQKCATEDSKSVAPISCSPMWGCKGNFFSESGAK
jgi:hypothetical protein